MGHVIDVAGDIIPGLGVDRGGVGGAGLKEDAQLAARWTRNAAGATALGTLHVTDFARYEQIKAVHNAAAKTLNRPELAWESTVEANSEVIIGR